MNLRFILLGLVMVLILAVEDTNGKKDWADYYAKRFKLSSNSLQKSLTQSRRASRLGQSFKRDMRSSRVARRVQPRAPPIVDPIVEVAGHNLPNLKEHIKKPWTTTSRERKMWPKHIRLELARRPWLMKRYESPQNMKYKPWSNMHDHMWHTAQLKRDSREQTINKPIFEAQPAYRFQPLTIQKPQVLPQPIELKLPITQSEISYQVRPNTQYVFKPLPQQDDPIEETSSEETGVLTLIDNSAGDQGTGTNKTKYFEYMHDSMGEKTIISSTSAERKHTNQGLLATILLEKPSSINSSIITAEASDLRLPPSPYNSAHVQAAFRPEPIVNVNPRKPIILPPPQQIPANIRPTSEYQYLERQPEEFQENPSEVKINSTSPPDSFELITEFEERVGDEMVKTKQFEYTNGDTKETNIISSISKTNVHVDQGIVAKIIVENPALPLVQNTPDNSASPDYQPAHRPDNLILRVPQILPEPKQITLTGPTSGPLYLEGSNTGFASAPESDTLQLIETIDEENNKTQLYQYNNGSSPNERVIISSVSIQKANNNHGILSKIIIDKPAIPLSIKNSSDNLENSQPAYSQGVISYESRNVQVHPLPRLITSSNPRLRYAERRPEEYVHNPNAINGQLDNNDNNLNLIETFDEDNGYDMNTTNLFEYKKEGEAERMVISSVNVKQPNINNGVKASIIIDHSTSENEFSNNINKPLSIQSLPRPELRTLPSARPSYLVHRPTEFVSIESIQNENNQNIIKAAESKLLQSKHDSKPLYLLGTPTVHQPIIANKVDDSVTERSSKPFSYVGHRYEGDIISERTNEEPHISSGIIDILNDPLPLVETNPLLGDVAAGYSHPGQVFAESYHVQVHKVDELP